MVEIRLGRKGHCPIPSAVLEFPSYRCDLVPADFLSFSPLLHCGPMVQGPRERQWGSSPSLGKKEGALGPLANLSTHRGSWPCLWLLQVSKMRSEQGGLQGWRVMAAGCKSTSCSRPLWSGLLAFHTSPLLRPTRASEYLCPTLSLTCPCAFLQGSCVPL